MTDERKTTVAIPATFPMTPADLKNLGLAKVGYLKFYNVNGNPAWVLHAADGTALAVQASRKAATESAMHNEIGLVSVH